MTIRFIKKIPLFNVVLGKMLLLLDYESNIPFDYFFINFKFSAKFKMGETF